MTDFVVESGDHCFLCSSQITSKFAKDNIKLTSQSSSFSSPPVYSLQSLSRYLKLDMRKVFHEDGPIPAHLLGKVQRSKLKVQLCDGCASLTETFAGLHARLEKIEMEMASNLKLILSKLEEAEKIAVADDSGPISVGKFQIVQVLKEETKLKCTDHLKILFPKVRINFMTEKKMEEKISKIKSKSKTDPPTLPSTATEDAPNQGDLEMDNDATFNSTFQDDGELDWNDYDPYPSSQEDNLLDHSEDKDIARHHAGAVDLVVKPEVLNQEIKTENSDDSSTIYGHRQRQPMKVKYKCKLCDKQFSFKQDFVRHHRGVHMKVRYECQKCSKLFTQKCNLGRHLKTCGVDKNKPH